MGVINLTPDSFSDGGRYSDPDRAFARAIELFYQPPTYAPGIHPTAVIGPDGSIAWLRHYTAG